VYFTAEDGGNEKLYSTRIDGGKVQSLSSGDDKGTFTNLAIPTLAKKPLLYANWESASSPGEIALLLGLARIGAVLVVFGMLVALAFGLWLVHLGDWGYGAGWVDAAIALLVVAAFLGAAGGQVPKRARLLASRLAGDGQPVSDELRALLRDRRTLAVNYGSALLVVAIVVLMVWKPGASQS